jgi:hypothetical protein
MKPYDFKWTRFYNENADFKSSFPEIEIDLSDNELVVCSTVIDINNFSVLTTQKLATKEKGKFLSGNLNGATDKLYGDFKGVLKNDPFTFGMVQLDNGNDFRYFIETGRASMVMIRGVRTRIQIGGMTNTQMDKVANIWTRRSNNEFYPLMKVSLNGEHGVIVDHFIIKDHTFSNWEDRNLNTFGIIRWDTCRESDFEDWRGLWGTFVARGGSEIARDYQFQFINDDGTFKAQ